MQFPKLSEIEKEEEQKYNEVEQLQIQNADIDAGEGDQSGVYYKESVLLNTSKNFHLKSSINVPFALYFE